MSLVTKKNSVTTKTVWFSRQTTIPKIYTLMKGTLLRCMREVPGSILGSGFRRADSDLSRVFPVAALKFSVNIFI
jgi:hypothetical protein